MKKLNTSNAFAMLALGFTLVVVAAGFGTNSVSADSQLMSTPTTKATKTGSSDSGAGNGTSKSAPTTTAKTGSSDGGSGNGSSTSSSVKSAPTTIAKSAPTTIAKTGSADGGTGKSVTVSDSELTTSGSTCFAINSSKYCTTLTKVQMNALTSAQWETVDGYLSSSQVASIPTKTIKNLSTTALIGLSSDGTKALTTAQLKVMSKDQLNALVSSGELTETQLVTVNKKLTQLG
ncbi:MAG: hypothetical protein F2712_01315 [Actinobacteria bacterium]|uniref:Unannotated protein n=1 Tax=freshwater metagenome TaxID=449393 RepID=A0A6J6U0Q3_9ZZZZ|nr:hypothetical protein [Actinomycetota bacterium]